MCNCMQERVEKLKELKECDMVSAPVEVLSGRVYLAFTGIKTTGGEQINIPLLLKKCPFCGEQY